MSKINDSNYQIYPLIIGEDDENTKLIIRDINNAVNYLKNQNWFEPIDHIKLAYGIGGIISIILVKFIRQINRTDEKLWVICGDLPTVYLVTDDINSSVEALRAYIYLMRQWTTAVKNGESTSELFPIGVTPDAEHASMLERRIDYLENQILKDLID